ncbi:MAG: gamma-glutamyl-gamma-aminobutyrate hydrolase family protein [Candidatus Dadabacteria bacterium]|nr:MAG: gamma-glutamyl-gamma-aminobutyrate hydrolase family protein [Candidatus Dadabacteria bacterium]
MPRLPLVGITCYTPAADGSENYSLPQQYVACLRAAGLEVAILPDGDAAMIERLDGLVLAGGGDLDPELYGGSAHPTIYHVDRRRDEFELRLLDRALAAGMPILAICRGMQILNVAFGGSLVPHIPERYGLRVAHRLPPRKPVPHAVIVRAETRVAQALGGRKRVEVVSWHHQAPDAVGEGLAVVAHAPDGVIEALEADDCAWVVGVQWHPELDAARNPAQADLFRGFAAAAAGWTKGGSA